MEALHVQWPWLLPACHSDPPLLPCGTLAGTLQRDPLCPLVVTSRPGQRDNPFSPCQFNVTTSLKLPGGVTFPSLVTVPLVGAELNAA